MRCLYINLDAATARRAALEASFAAAPHEGWDLVRFGAVDARQAGGLPGKLTAVEKAVLCSHRAAITGALDDAEDLLIVEDDVRFTSRCFAAIAEQLGGRDDWDVAFTETLITDPGTMLRLAKARSGLVREGEFRLLDLSTTKFASASAYVVNGRSKAKLAGLLAKAEVLDLPYDIALRRLVENGHIRAFAIFPFVTAISEHGDASQIQPDALSAADFVLRTFSRLMCVERDEAACRDAARYIEDELCDEEARLAGAVFAGIVSPRFPEKR